MSAKAGNRNPNQNQNEKRNAADGSLASHYEAAQKAQSAGEYTLAEQEYKRFLAEALRRLSNRLAAAGDLISSARLLRESLELIPSDADLRLTYAKACRAAGDLTEAKSAAENVLILEPRNAAAHVELGRILTQMGDDTAATLQYESAVAIEPSFENGYVLAKHYLKRKEPEQAARIFGEMISSFGDSAELHLKFGSAYGEEGYPERGIPEFEKALGQDPKIRGGHYSLGAAYLLGLGDVMQDRAESEFRAELGNYPNDPLSLYQLGSIEFNRHQFEQAEKELLKVIKLDERNPDAYLLLGQIYNETGRSEEAEKALRRSIELTTNPARNHYQVQGAHYLLARILAQSGHTDEAKKEMQIANQLLKENTMSMQGVPVPARDGAPGALQPPVRLDPETMREADAFQQKIKGAVGDSYNNLGAMAASAGKFQPALQYFEQAAKWSPSLEGLDYNWGRAAFSAAHYKEAIAPLARFLENHPDDTWVRAALGSSYFSLRNYQEAARTLQPMEPLLPDRPQLNYIYSVSLMKSGDLAAGVKRLEDLERANPSVALIPEALAEAYIKMGEPEKAARERARARALQQDPATTSPSGSQPQRQ